MAQPAPVQAPPTPTAPVPPGNAEECAIVNLEVVCAPGTDADGFQFPGNGLGLDVQDGSVVQGTIDLLTSTTGTIDGSIVTSNDFEDALIVGTSSNITINGNVFTTGETSLGIFAGNDSVITNNGVIYTTGDIVSDGVTLDFRSTLVNNGLIQTDGFDSFGVFAFGDFVNIQNTATGSIITGGDNAFAIAAGNGAVIQNDGLIQTFGFDSFGVEALAGATVTNTGIVFTTGDGSFGVQVRNDSSIINTEGAWIFTFGDDLASVVVGQDGVVQNDGIILTRGDNAIAVVGGQDSTITLGATSQISTTGLNSGAVVVNGDGTITNGGLIQTTGVDAQAITVSGEADLTNSGTITAALARAVDLGGVSTVTNTDTGVISSKGGDGIRFNAGGSTLVNAGVLESDAGDALSAVGLTDITVTNDGIIRATANGSSAIDAGDGLTVTNTGSISSFESGSAAILAADGLVLDNSGTISTQGTSAAAVFATANASVTNSGTISTSQNRGVALVAGAGSVVDNTDTGSIATALDEAHAIVFTGDATLNNAGSVSTIGVNSFGVISTGGLTLDNSGAIAAQFGRGLDIAGTADVTNSGSITSGADDAVRLNTDGAVTNTGTISGVTGIDGRSGAQTVINLGTIEGTGGDAVLLRDGDDFYAQVNDGTATGTVDGSIGNDVYAYIITDTTDRSFSLDAFGLSVLGFEDIRIGSQTFDFINGTTMAPVATGVVTLTGSTDQALSVVNTAILDGTVNNTVTLVEGAGDGIAPGLTITSTGGISTSGDAQIGFDSRLVDGAFLVNGGSILTTGMSTAAVYLGSNSTVTNTGSIRSEGTDGVAIAALDGSTVSNAAGGTITTTGDNGFGIVIVGSGSVANDGVIAVEGADAQAVTITGDGTVTNSGILASDSGRAIDIAGVATVTNAAGGIIGADTADTIRFNSSGSSLVNDGSILSGSGFALDLSAIADTTVTNSGSISSTGNAAIAANSFDLTNSGTISSDSDAGITFVSSNASVVTNLAGGVISGATFGIDGGADAGAQTIVNFGSIVGATDAVSLGDGADVFQQWTGASTTGNIDLGGGDDVFVLEGANSTVGGMIMGGAGTDTAILGGTLDADNLTGFETTELGTLFDLTISGNRTLTGDVVHTGNVFVNLGVDSLTTDGQITLESTGTLTIGTPLDFDLVGQTVTVFDPAGGLVNNGATVVILDDDLLIDYTPVGGLAIQVTASNPLINSNDPNITAFGNALQGGFVAGTVSDANFLLLNNLPDSATLADAAVDALPSLSDGEGREIFEASSAASQALDRHLAGEGTAIWGQIQIRGATQDALSPSAGGYDSEQTILTVGADLFVADGIRAGLLASYADIENEEFFGNVETGEVEIESIKLGAYVGIDLFERGFLNTEIAYLTGDIQDERSGVLNQISSAYDFDGIAIRSVFGYDLLADENVSLTPTIGVNAAEINFDDAVESGGFGFLVERGDAQYVELRGGIELASQLSEGVNGFISGTIIHDLEDSPRSFRLSSSELPTFFAQLPLREQDRFELAAGASIDVSDTIAVEVGYQGDFNSGYDAHAGRASLRIAF